MNKYIFEFAGMPKSGKSTIISIVGHYLKRIGFKVKIMPDWGIRAPIDKENLASLNLYIANKVINEILTFNVQKTDNQTILLLDRGPYDRVFWTELLKNLEKIENDECISLNGILLSNRVVGSISKVFIFNCSAKTSLIRENKHSMISLHGRIMNNSFLNYFSKTIDDLGKGLSIKSKKAILVNTENLNEKIKETAQLVIDEIINSIISDEHPDTFLGVKFNQKNRFTSSNGFIIDKLFDRNNYGPNKLKIGGKYLYRFMDFIYSPITPYQLNSNQVIDICEVRLKYINSLVDKKFNKKIVDLMFKVAEDKYTFSKSSKVLDFGCGSGLSTIAINNHLGKYRLKAKGIDPSEMAVKVAKENSIDAFHSNLNSKLPIDDYSIDIVFSLFVFHFNIQRHSLIELHRIMKKKSILIFNTYNVDIEVVFKSLSDVGFIRYETIDINNLPDNHNIHICYKE